MNMDDLVQGAAMQGLTLVDSEGNEALFEEYDEKMEEVNRLLEIIDPENKPYESKYKAREVLDQLCKKCEASKTIATLENKKSYVEQLSIRIAALKVKTGSISWDCEEPHSTQEEVEIGCEFYFPGLIKQIEEIVKDRDELNVEADGKLAADIIPNFEDLTIPQLPTLNIPLIQDGLTCLNLLGILWAGRGQPHKSLLYLLLAQSLHTQYSTTLPIAMKALPINAPVLLSKSQKKEIENAYTHTLFYLAQAYGHLKSAKLSSYYCKLTLQRQYETGSLVDIKTSLEWIKNCVGLSDFYLSLEQYTLSMIILLSAEGLLKDKIIPLLYTQMDKEKQAVTEMKATNERPNFVSGNLNAAEIEADLHHRIANVDSQILRKACEIHKEMMLAQEMQYDSVQLRQEIMAQYASGSQEEDEEIAQLQQQQATSANNNANKIAFFEGLLVSIPTHTKVLSIDSFESARIVFLRAIARIDLAKKYYLLDGFVTDHCTLLQEYSKLYHYLQEFEMDFKRKIAMENKRIELLLPLLKQLNKTSYEVLHKQISYELGETYLALLDLKLDKVRHRSGDTGSTEMPLKKSEMIKCNDYCKMGIACFSHFLYLYATSEDRQNNNNQFSYFETLSIPDLVNVFHEAPDETLITEEEVRPYCMAQFLICRLLQKIIITAPGALATKTTPKGVYLIQCLKRYSWLQVFVPKICLRRGIEINAVFGEEYNICVEMAKLLPSKIDRMCFLGESGLTL